LAIGGCIVSLLKGSVNISYNDVWRILIEGGTSAKNQIVLNIRLPRTLVAALVGMNLSLSGAILQAVMKNPLADPHIIGISSASMLHVGNSNHVSEEVRVKHIRQLLPLGDEQGQR
jgi:iron complex transport system permease protein